MLFIHKMTELICSEYIVMSYTNHKNQQRSKTTFLFSPNESLWERMNHSQYSLPRKVIAIICLEGLGDYFSALNLSEPLTKDYDVAVLVLPRGKLQSPYIKKSLDYLYHDLNPDLSIFLHDIEHLLPSRNPYLMISDPSFFLSLKNTSSQNIYPYLSSYQGYLISAGEEHINAVQDIVKKENQYFQPFYHTGMKIDVPLPIDMKKIFYCAALWDSQRSKENFISAYQYLDKKNIIDFYGPELWTEYVKNYKGFLPFDRNNFLYTMNQYGISLILHSYEHLSADILSARVFEAICARTIMISDEMSCLKKIFGDNILYVDVNETTGVPLGEQIEQHYLWIQNHPQEAYEMIQKCYEIYENNFEGLGQMQKLLRYALQEK